MKATKIRIECDSVYVDAFLNDSATARSIIKNLPITGKVNRCGDEIYFEIPVKTTLESGSRAEVEVGELGYWPNGHAFCIFFGKTPASVDGKPRAASAVNIIGRVTTDARALAVVKDGEKIKIKPGE